MRSLWQTVCYGILLTAINFSDLFIHRKTKFTVVYVSNIDWIELLQCKIWTSEYGGESLAAYVYTSENI